MSNVQNPNICDVEVLITPTPQDDPCSDIISVTFDYFSAKSKFDGSIFGNETPHQVSGYKKDMDDSASKAIRIMMQKEDCYERDSLFVWLERLERVEGELWRSNAYLSDGNLSQAIQILDEIPYKFTLSGNSENDVNNYKTVTELIGNESIYQLSLTTQEALAVYEDIGGFTQGWVQNIRSFYGEDYAIEHMISRAEERKAIGNDKMKNTSSIQVHPNPAKDIVHFKSNFNMTYRELSLLIKDTSGKIITSFKNEGHLNASWNASTFPTGIYFYQVITDGEMLESGKVIIIK